VTCGPLVTTPSVTEGFRTDDRCDTLNTISGFFFRADSVFYMLPRSQNPTKPEASLTPKRSISEDMIVFLEAFISGLKASIAHFVNGKRANLVDENLYFYDDETKLWTLRSSSSEGKESNSSSTTLNTEILNLPPASSVNMVMDPVPFRGVFGTTGNRGTIGKFNPDEFTHPVYAPSGSLMPSRKFDDSAPSKPLPQAEIRKSPFNR
jgi:hypothetical protein